MAILWEPDAAKTELLSVKKAVERVVAEVLLKAVEESQRDIWAAEEDDKMERGTEKEVDEVDETILLPVVAGGGPPEKLVTRDEAPNDEEVRQTVNDDSRTNHTATTVAKEEWGGDARVGEESSSQTTNDISKDHKMKNGENAIVAPAVNISEYKDKRVTLSDAYDDDDDYDDDDENIYNDENDNNNDDDDDDNNDDCQASNNEGEDENDSRKDALSSAAVSAFMMIPKRAEMERRASVATILTWQYAAAMAEENAAETAEMRDKMTGVGGGDDEGKGEVEEEGMADDREKEEGGNKVGSDARAEKPGEARETDKVGKADYVVGEWDDVNDVSEVGETHRVGELGDVGGEADEGSGAGEVCEAEDEGKSDNGGKADEYRGAGEVSNAADVGRVGETDGVGESNDVDDVENDDGEREEEIGSVEAALNLEFSSGGKEVEIDAGTGCQPEAASVEGSEAEEGSGSELTIPAEVMKTNQRRVANDTTADSDEDGASATQPLEVYDGNVDESSGETASVAAMEKVSVASDGAMKVADEDEDDDDDDDDHDDPIERDGEEHVARQKTADESGRGSDDQERIALEQRRKEEEGGNQISKGENPAEVEAERVDPPVEERNSFGIEISHGHADGACDDAGIGEGNVDRAKGDGPFESESSSYLDEEEKPIIPKLDLRGVVAAPSNEDLNNAAKAEPTSPAVTSPAVAMATVTTVTDDRGGDSNNSEEANSSTHGRQTPHAPRPPAPPPPPRQVSFSHRGRRLVKPRDDSILGKTPSLSSSPSAPPNASSSRPTVARCTCSPDGVCACAFAPRATTRNATRPRSLGAPHLRRKTTSDLKRHLAASGGTQKRTKEEITTFASLPIDKQVHLSVRAFETKKLLQEALVSAKRVLYMNPQKSDEALLKVEIRRFKDRIKDFSVPSKVTSLSTWQNFLYEEIISLDGKSWEKISEENCHRLPAVEEKPKITSGEPIKIIRLSGSASVLQPPQVSKLVGWSEVRGKRDNTYAGNQLRCLRSIYRPLLPPGHNLKNIVNRGTAWR